MAKLICILGEKRSQKDVLKKEVHRTFLVHIFFIAFVLSLLFLLQLPQKSKILSQKINLLLISILSNGLMRLV